MRPNKAQQLTATARSHFGLVSFCQQACVFGRPPTALLPAAVRNSGVVGPRPGAREHKAPPGREVVLPRRISAIGRGRRQTASRPPPEADIKFSRYRLEIADPCTNWNDDATGRVPVRRAY